MDYIYDAEQSVTDLQPAIKYNFSPPFSPCVLKRPSFLHQVRIYERRRKRVQYKIGVHAPTGNSGELETYGWSWSNEWTNARRTFTSRWISISSEQMHRQSYAKWKIVAFRYCYRVFHQTGTRTRAIDTNDRTCCSTTSLSFVRPDLYRVSSAALFLRGYCIAFYRVSVWK